MVASGVAGAGAAGDAVMSTSLGQPPDPRWYLRTLSASARASVDAYHAAGCSSTSCHRTRDGTCAHTCEAATAATIATAAHARLRTEHQRVRYPQPQRPHNDPD